MRRRRGSEDDYDFLKEEGMLGQICICDEDSHEGCPIHDPLYHDRKKKNDDRLGKGGDV
jgi:hypothetical protein